MKADARAAVLPALRQAHIVRHHHTNILEAKGLGQLQAHVDGDHIFLSIYS